MGRQLSSNNLALESCFCVFCDIVFLFVYVIAFFSLRTDVFSWLFSWLFCCCCSLDVSLQVTRRLPGIGLTSVEVLPLCGGKTIFR